MRDPGALYVCDSGCIPRFFPAADLAGTLHPRECPGSYRPAEYDEHVRSTCWGGCGDVVEVVNYHLVFPSEFYCKRCEPR